MTDLMKATYMKLYEHDEDFKKYVDKMCESKKIAVTEALELQIIKGYGEYVKEAKRGRVESNIG